MNFLSGNNERKGSTLWLRVRKGSKGMISSRKLEHLFEQENKKKPLGFHQPQPDPPRRTAYAITEPIEPAVTQPRSQTSCIS